LSKSLTIRFSGINFGMASNPLACLTWRRRKRTLTSVAEGDDRSGPVNAPSISPGKVAQLAVRRQPRRGAERIRIRVLCGILAPGRAGKPEAVRCFKLPWTLGRGQSWRISRRPGKRGKQVPRGCERLRQGNRGLFVSRVRSMVVEAERMRAPLSPASVDSERVVCCRAGQRDATLVSPGQRFLPPRTRAVHERGPAGGLGEVFCGS
jgi:hypothetical protein